MRRSLFLAPLFLAGCRLPFGGGPDCIDETRGFDVTAAIAGPDLSVASDSGTAFLHLFESRNASSKRTSAEEMTWNVRAPGVVRAEVTSIHVHERANGQLLIQIPIDTLESPAITNTYTRQPAPAHTVSWANLYQLVGDDRTYIDVHVAGPSPRVLRGDLSRQGDASRDWRAFVHAYCS
jgi:hypothetical protein